MWPPRAVNARKSEDALDLALRKSEPEQRLDRQRVERHRSTVRPLQTLTTPTPAAAARTGTPAATRQLSIARLQRRRTVQHHRPTTGTHTRTPCCDTAVRIRPSRPEPEPVPTWNQQELDTSRGCPGCPNQSFPNRTQTRPPLPKRAQQRCPQPTARPPPRSTAAPIASDHCVPSSLQTFPEQVPELAAEDRIRHPFGPLPQRQPTPGPSRQLPSDRTTQHHHCRDRTTQQAGAKVTNWELPVQCR